MKDDILSTLKDQFFLATKQCERKRQVTRIPTFRTSVGARKEKCIFSLSPINSRKEGRKKGRIFYPRQYIATSGEILTKTRGRYWSRFFLELQKCE